MSATNGPLTNNEWAIVFLHVSSLGNNCCVFAYRVEENPEILLDNLCEILTNPYEVFYSQILKKSNHCEAFYSRILMKSYQNLFVSKNSGTTKLLNTVPYFGLQMNTRYLQDNKFINFFLASIVEVPAHFATWYSIAHYGRRICLLTAFITAAVSGLLPYAFASYKIVHVIATFIGKGCTSSAYITLYVQGPELFPLFLRAAGIGLCCTVGSIGGIIAPYAVYTYKYADYAPFLIFSGIMTLATVCASCLPETSHKKLPITVADAENFQRNWKFFNCPGCPVMDAEPLRSEVLLSFEEAEVRREQDSVPERNWSTLFPSKSDTVLFRKNMNF
ncbi:carcinine transporter [Caerostris darwini]|uniref:Carcinine transporter n=1 Tax=Caerostris darwini TaxID=1538125 RepID=A0AAV4XA55_9ARAC|nr:carcinine transporter [Caerostris darwini]